MSSDGRQSPRAAIRNWLSHNDGKSRATGPRLDSVDDAKKDRRPRERHRPRTYANAEAVPLQPHAIRSRNRNDNQGDRFRKRSDKPTATRPDSGVVSLAERLNLHSPFRSFGDGNGFEDLSASRLGHAKKRRRSPSSTSSLLEPALLSDEPQDDCRDGRDGKVGKVFSSRKRDVRHREETPQSSSEPSQLPSDTLILPEKPAKIYEKRPRHKTKEDRYEIKQHEVAAKQKKGKKDRKKGEAKKDKKSKVHRKSGAALIHDFAAQNVAQDRLTLKPAASIGLFARGRASLPVRRRGLPDLTFSEMTFLNPRGERSEEPVRSRDKEKRRKRDKAAGNEAEISRYFASAKARDGNAATTEKERARTPSERFANLDRSSLPPVELLERPFLGFGSVGGDLVSPVRRSELPLSPPPRFHSTQRELSPTRSLSYFTWSKTGPPSDRSSRPSHKQIVPPIPSKRPQAAGDSTRGGQKTSSGVPVSHDDDAAENIVHCKSRSRNDCSANFMKTADVGVSNDPQEQSLYSLPGIDDPKGQQTRYNMTRFCDDPSTRRAPQAAVAKASDPTETRTNPPLAKSSNDISKMPEDLVNATLKLLLDKYGDNIKGPFAMADAANETMKPPDVTVSEEEQEHGPATAKTDNEAARSSGVTIIEEDQKNSAHQFLDPATGGGTKPIAEGSDQGRDRHSHGSRRPVSWPNHPSNEGFKAPSDTQRSRHTLHARQSPKTSLIPSLHHRSDAKSAWNGYDALYEQQSMPGEPQINLYGDHIRDDLQFDEEMIDYRPNISGHELEDRYGPRLSDVYKDCNYGTIYDNSTYHCPSEAQSYQRLLQKEEMRTQHFDELSYHLQPMEARDDGFLHGQEEYLPSEGPRFVDYDMPTRDQGPPSEYSFTQSLSVPQSATLDSNTQYTRFRTRRLQEEPPQAFILRPRTQDSTYASIQQHSVPVPDQPDDASLSGFWKPHKLY